ncbi:hypothetical protein ACHAPA_011071 [Fusarium lateritium]
MLYSMAFSAITSLLGALVMAFCIGNWETYLETDLPILPWFIEVLNGSNVGGSVFIMVVIVLLK